MSRATPPRTTLLRAQTVARGDADHAGAKRPERTRPADTARPSLEGAAPGVYSLAAVPVTQPRPVVGVAQLTKKDATKRAQSEAFWVKKNARLARQAEAEATAKARLEAAQQAHRTGMQSMLGSELAPAVKAHEARVTAHTSAHAQKITGLTGDKRPNKPPSLVAKHDGESLTAHHLLPYNFIRDNFADALGKQDTTGVSRFMAFAGRENVDSSEAYRLMAPKSAHRPSAAWKKHQAEARAEQKKHETVDNKGQLPTIVQDASERSGDGEMDSFFQSLTWSPHNVFMGPKPAQRLDDPHEGLDARVRPDGSLSESSKLARALHEGGMASMTPAEIASRVVRSSGEADGPQGTRRFDPTDWSEHGDMRQQKGSEIHNRRREKWTQKGNWQKLQQLGYIDAGEADAMKAKVAAARRAKSDRWRGR